MSVRIRFDLTPSLDLIQFAATLIIQCTLHWTAFCLAATTTWTRRQSWYSAGAVLPLLMLLHLILLLLCLILLMLDEWIIERSYLINKFKKKNLKIRWLILLIVLVLIRVIFRRLMLLLLFVNVFRVKLGE